MVDELGGVKAGGSAAIFVCRWANPRFQKMSGTWDSCLEQRVCRGDEAALLQFAVLGVRPQTLIPPVVALAQARRIWRGTRSLRSGALRWWLPRGRDGQQCRGPGGSFP